ncbi:MAG TPA: hypothetical protein VN779_05135, partial [Actinocrinis sp.]
VGGAVLSAYGGAPLWIGCFAVTGLTALVFLRIGKHVERRVAAARSAEAEADQTKVTATAIADGQQPELATA